MAPSKLSLIKTVDNNTPAPGQRITYTITISNGGGVNAANVLKPSNMALTLFSPLGSFYRYAVVERRVAWPVGLSFGVGIFIGSIWLGKYVSAVLPMKAYKEWLAILVVIMGIQTLRELRPAAMEKRKNIKAMVKKFNEAVAKAKSEGTSVEMGRIEPVKSSLVDYRFKFWGEEFKINPLLFAILGLAIGVVSRSFGIGGGFLLVPAMTTLGALPMYVAVPISLIGTSFSSIGAFIGYLMTGYFPDLWLMISIIIGGFGGGMLGSRAQKLFSEKTLKVVLAITLFFNQRFPGISAACNEFGIDIARDRIPVRPGAHYMIGGATVDASGRTTLPGLWAAGEVSASGLHGANRLASNSLLEGLVFGVRAGRQASAAAAAIDDNLTALPLSNVSVEQPTEPLDLADIRNSLQSLMWRAAGVQRDRQLGGAVVDEDLGVVVEGDQIELDVLERGAG